MLRRCLIQSLKLKKSHLKVYSTRTSLFSTSKDTNKADGSDLPVFETKNILNNLDNPYDVEKKKADIADAELVPEPDDDTCLVDVDEFNTKQYLLDLLNPTKKLEGKDEFPAVMIVIYTMFFIYMVKIKVWGRSNEFLVESNTSQSAGMTQFGMGEKAQVKFDIEAFEHRRDFLIRKYNSI